jgi:hypothetical protein
MGVMGLDTSLWDRRLHGHANAFLGQALEEVEGMLLGTPLAGDWNTSKGSCHGQAG